MSGVLWAGVGAALGCAVVLLANAFWPGTAASDHVAALAGAASALAALAMFATLHFLREQLDILRRQTETLREQTDAVLKQAAQHEEELRYYYEPGVYVQVYQAHRGEALRIRAVAATQTRAFDVRVGWKGETGHAQEMDVPVAGAPGSIPAGPHGVWHCPCLPPDKTAWAELTWKDPEGQLVVTWKHLTRWRWKQVWRLVQTDENRWDLVPEGPPEREPLGTSE